MGQLLCVCYDDLSKDPKPLLGEVLEHIGVQIDIDCEKRPCNNVYMGAKRPSEISEKYCERLLEHYIVHLL